MAKPRLIPKIKTRMMPIVDSAFNMCGGLNVKAIHFTHFCCLVKPCVLSAFGVCAIIWANRL